MSEKKYLDKVGLEYFYNKMKNQIDAQLSPQIETATGTSLQINDAIKLKLDALKGNITQKVIEAVAGTTVSETDITINDYDDSKESKFEALGGDTNQATIQYIDVGSWEQGTILADNGQNSNSNDMIRTAGYISVKSNILYNIERNIATSFMIFRFYDSSYNYLGYQNTSGMVTTNKSDNRMTENESSMEMTINNINIAYMRISDNSNDLSTIYTISTEATPSPDYPQDIQVVKGENNVKVQNKNKLPYPSNFELTNLGLTISQSGGVYNIQGKSTNTGFVINSQSIASYTIQTGDYLHLFNNITLSNLAFVLNFSDNTQISYAPILKYRILDLSQHVNKTIVSIQFYINSADIDVDIALQPMILNNISTTTSYIAHQEQNYPISLSNIEQGTISSINGSNSNATNRIRTKTFDTVETSTQYTISAFENYQVAQFYYEEDETYISSVSWNDLPYTFTTPSNCKKIKFAFRKSANNEDITPDEITGVKLTGTNFEHLYTIELAKIGTYRDKLIKKSDGWYVRKEINKINLKNYNFNLQADLGKVVRGHITFTSNNIPEGSAIPNGLCDSLIFEANFTTNKEHFYVQTNLFIFVAKSRLETADQTGLNNYIHTNDFIVYYQLKTPTETKITDITLISQLEAIEEATGYNGTMYITSSNSGNDLAIVPTYHYNYVIPAPSPDRESEIQIVKGENIVKVENKNLLNTSVVQSVFNEAGNTRQGFYFVAKSDETYTIDFNFCEHSYYFRAIKSIESNEGLSSTYFSKSLKVQTFNLLKGQAIVLWNTDGFENDKIQMVKGSTVPSIFIPHQEQNYTIILPTGMELAKIGDYKDRIYGTLDNWYLEKKIGKVVLDGSEDEGWNRNATYTNNTRFTSTTNILNKVNTDVFCNYFLNGVGGTDTVNVSLNGSSGALMLTLPNEIASNVTELKSWLALHINIVYYILEAPVDVPITDTTLINQLNTIYNNIKAYDEQTNISQINAELPFEIELEVYNDNIGTRVALLEEQVTNEAEAIELELSEV